MALIDASNKVIYQLLKVAYGDPSRLGGGSRTELYFTNSPEKLVINDITYTPYPSIEIEFAPNFALIEEKPTKIKTERGDSGFFFDITSGEPFAEVDVLITEAIFNSDMVAVPELKFMFNGKIDKTFKNYQQKKNVILIECITQKSFLEAPLGRIVTHQCGEPFGRGKCQAAVRTHPIVGSSISGTRLIHIGLSIPNEFKPDYFEEGFMLRNNIPIKIKKWDGNATFDLLRAPPSEWIGQEIFLYGGCNKTIEACREPIRNREEDFTGIGFAVPDINPLRPTATTAG